MIDFEVSTNAAEVSGFLMELFADQIPFATARAINRTAIAFQAEERDRLTDRFTIRRPWVLQGVKINRGDFATKTKPEAIVRIDPGRDFLIKFEEGGTKRPRSGTRLAVPDEARRTKTGVVTRAQRPRAFGFVEHGRGVKAVVYRGQKRTFMVLRHSGRGEIYQRYGRRGRGSGFVRRLFVFTPSVEVDARLEFEDTARRVVQTRFEDHFGEEFDRAVRTAR